MIVRPGVPSQLAVSSVVGYIKGKSAIHVARHLPNVPGQVCLLLAPKAAQQPTCQKCRRHRD